MALQPQPPINPQDIEMRPYQGISLPLHEFLNRVGNIRESLRALSSEVDGLATLHQRTLASTAPYAAQPEVDRLFASAQFSNRSIRESIQILKADVENTTDSNVFRQKRRQVETLTKEFRGLVQKLLDEERHYQARRREAIARQYRLVNPNASENEVRSVVEGDVNVFQSALLNGRSGQASNTLGTVRARQNEVQQIEQSIAELARLFQDLEQLVILDEPKFREIDRQMEQVDLDVSKATEEIQVAQRSALNRRKLKWILLGVVTTIIIVIVVAILIWLKLTGKL